MKDHEMKNYMLAAIILIGVGIAAFAYQGITYTTREKAFELGTLHVTTEKTHTIPLPPIVGGLALVGGILLLVAEKRRFV